MFDEIIKKIKNAKNEKNWSECISLCRSALNTKDEVAIYGIKLNLAFSLLKERDKDGRYCSEAIKIYNSLIPGIEKYSERWGEIQKNLGYAYSINPCGNKEDNLLESIKYYKKSLKVISKENSPVLWASINAQIGFAYQSLQKGWDPNIIDKAIWYFNESLKVFKNEQFPEDWKEISDAVEELKKAKMK